MSGLIPPGATTQALVRNRGLGPDAETQRLAFVRERALRDERSELFGAREKGFSQGFAQGQAAILERLLRRRFGPFLSEATRTRLQTATPAQLESWAERLLVHPTATRSSRSHEGHYNHPSALSANLSSRSR